MEICRDMAERYERKVYHGKREKGVAQCNPNDGSQEVEEEMQEMTVKEK